MCIRDSLQAVHEGGVVHAVQLAGGIDPGDPKLTEVALLQLAAGIGVHTGLHDSLVGHLIMLGLGTPVALGPVSYTHLGPAGQREVYPLAGGDHLSGW